MVGIIGKLISVEQVVELGRVHLRSLQWELKRLLQFPTALNSPIPVTLQLSFTRNGGATILGYPKGFLCTPYLTRGKWSQMPPQWAGEQ